MADTILTTLRLIGQGAYISGARASAAAVRDIGAASNEATPGQRLLRGSMSATSGMFGVLTSAAKGAGLAIGAVTLYAAKMGLEFDANVERATVGLTTLLDSAKLAQSTIRDVTQFAIHAPLLDVAQAAQTSQQLIGAGLSAKEAVPTLRAFSDTLSAMGRRPEDLQRMTYAFQQMLSKGRVTAEELRGQLGEIFPASRLLAKGMGISMAELAARMKEGSVEGIKPIRILLAQMEKEFGGATKRSAQTFSGMWANIKEQAAYNAGLVFQPLFVVLRDKVFPWTQKISDQITNWAKGGGAQALLDSLRAGFEGKPVDTTRQRRSARAPGRATEPVAPESQHLSMTAQIGQRLGGVFSFIVTQAKALWAALQPAKPFLDNILIPFVKGFAVGLLGGITALIPVIRILATILGFVGTHLAFLKPAFFALGAVIGFVFGPAKIGIFRVFGEAIAFLGRPILAVINWLLRFGDTGLRIQVMFLNVVSKIGGFLSGLVGRFAGWATSVAGAGVRAVAGLLRPFANFGSSVASKIMNGIGAVFSAAASFGKAIADGIWNALPGWLQSALSGAGGLLGKIGDILGGGPSGQTAARTPMIAVPAGPTIRPPTGARAPQFRQHGGWSLGPTVVGEAGPELLHLPRPGYIQPLTPGSGAALPHLAITLNAPIYLNRSLVGRAVAQDTSDRAARR
jgi:tape measure domain-containing protein